MPPENRNYDSTVLIRKSRHVRPRDFLKAVGVGVATSAVGAGNAPGQSGSVAKEPVEVGPFIATEIGPADDRDCVIGQYAKDPTPEERGPTESELYGTRIAAVEFNSPN